MMSLTFGLFTQVSDSGPYGPLALYSAEQNNIQILHHSLAATVEYSGSLA